MPSEPRASRPRSAKSLAAVSVLALAALAGCIGGPTRPTTPTYSGVMRPDPSRPPRPGEPLPSEPVSDRYAESRNAYMPRHIPRNEQQAVKRIAVLLPFNSTNPEVQRQTKGLYNAIQMALFEIGSRDVVLMPRDASNTDPQAIARVADDVVKDGAIAVIGPLLAQQVAPVASQAAEVHAPVLAFSTNVSAVGQGAYLVSLTPRSEIERVVEWAAQQGVTRFAFFGPSTPDGRTAETILRETAAQRGAAVVGAEFYVPDDIRSPQAAAQRLGPLIKNEIAANPGKVAVLIPEGGTTLRNVASLLPLGGGFSTREVKFLGTGLWNDKDVWRETSLRGGVFAAPDPTAQADFERRYQATFGEAPPNLASYGYDAGALAATLAGSERLDTAMIQRPQGWGGVNGLFRFLPDGSAQRALAVMQLQDGDRKIVSPAAKMFGPGS